MNGMQPHQSAGIFKQEPFDKLMVLSMVEGLMVLSKVEGTTERTERFADNPFFFLAKNPRGINERGHD